MLYHNSDNLIILIIIIIFSLLLITILSNLMYIILLFISIIINLALILVSLNNDFISFWLIIIYGGALTMFIMLSSTLSKQNKVGIKKINYFMYFIHPTTILIIYLAIVFCIHTSCIFSNHYYIWDYMINYNSVNNYNIQSLTNYLFNIHGGVILNLGFLLLQVIIGSILILFSEDI